jgi:CBS domain-containing protein
LVPVIPVPVVDQRGVCVGVLSDVDVYKFLGHFVPSEQVNQMKSTKVKEVMSMPALVVHAHAHVADAAGMLIKHKIHRLPVVEESDGELIVVGILSRADVFEPVIPDNTPDALLSRMAGGAARDEPHFADD